MSALPPLRAPRPAPSPFRSYYKTGSLMANSCKAIALLGCYPEAVANAAFRYGLHVGVAFQLVDDMLGAC